MATLFVAIGLEQPPSPTTFGCRVFHSRAAAKGSELGVPDGEDNGGGEVPLGDDAARQGAELGVPRVQWDTGDQRRGSVQEVRPKVRDWVRPEEGILQGGVIPSREQELHEGKGPALLDQPGPPYLQALQA